MRLRTILSDRPRATLDALESCNIRTDEDFLFPSSALPEVYHRLPPDSMSFSDLEEIRDIVLGSMAVSGFSGTSLLEDGRNSKIFPLNWTNWTERWPEMGTLFDLGQSGIIEISGRNGSAKTALLLNLALAYLESSQDAIVHWIDTVGDFSAERASKILSASSWKMEKQIPPEIISTTPALDRLHVSLAFTAEAAHSVLHSIRSAAISSASSDADSPLGLRPPFIIIDPITPLFSPHLTPGSSEGHAMLSGFMRDLQDLTSEYGIVALVSNNASVATSSTHGLTSSLATPKLRPALGLTMTFLTDTTLWLTPARRLILDNPNTDTIMDHDNGEMESAEQTLELGRVKALENLFVAEVLRSRSHVGHTCWSFRLDDDGVIHETSITP